MKSLKILASVMALVLAMSLFGCGEEKAEESEVVPSESSETSETSETSEPAEEKKESATAEDIKSEGVMTHKEYMEAAIEDKVVVEAYVQAKQSWWEDKATIYAQDKDGAYFIYKAACPKELYEKLVPGTKIKATGFKAEWSGEIEVVDANIEVIDGDTYMAEALDVTEILGSDDLINHQNEFVSFKGMTVEDKGDGAAYLYKWDGSGKEGDDLYFDVSLNGNKYTFTVESYLCDKDSDVYKAVKNLKVGDKVDMEGFLYWYEKANPHITSVTVK